MISSFSLYPCGNLWTHADVLPHTFEKQLMSECAVLSIKGGLKNSAGPSPSWVTCSPGSQLHVPSSYPSMPILDSWETGGVILPAMFLESRNLDYATALQWPLQGFPSPHPRLLFFLKNTWAKKHKFPFVVLGKQTYLF